MSDGGVESLRVICGPTAAGKSAIALALAERYGATIISADSRQVYRGFDLGTAKPTAAERARVPHRGIDVAEPTERYSAAEWSASAERWIAEARAAGRVPLVVGGTGFFIRALVDPLFEEPPIDAARRERLESLLAPLSFGELRRRVEVLDPQRAHLGRAQLVRAIVVALLTGRRLSDLHRTAARAPRFRARYLAVDPGPELAHRIERRTTEMLTSGWVDEVARLRAHVPPDAPAWKSTGYRTVLRLLDGALTPAAAHREIVIETRQYAKRQRTWFRHQLDEAATVRVDPLDPASAAAIEAWWEGSEGA